MKKLSKLWQKWVLDVVLNHTPPLITVIITVFITVFAIGYWCAHWADQVDLAAYKPYDVFVDNIVNKQVLNVFQDILPIDVVYTWVNGSDPLLIDGLKKVINELQTHCPLSHCVPAPYIAIQQGSVYTSVLAGLFGIEKVTNVTLKQGTTSKDFNILQMSSDADFDNTLAAVKIAVGNSSYPRPTFWTTDLESGFGLQVAGTSVLLLPDYMTLNEAMHMLTMGNTDVIQDCKTDLYERTAVIQCKNTKNMDLLLASSKKLSEFSGPRPAVMPAKLMVWMDYTDQYKEKDINRYEDNEELRYSLRSLEKYAPWVRKIFLVTNGQIPHWLNLDHPRIKIIHHNQIFVDQTHLPTYSSPAIEANIHRIPGLSEHFLYLNDDALFGLPVWPQDFYSLDDGYKVYLSWRLPDCAAGCPGYWIGDGYCDSNCNNSKCNWDGGDCSKDKQDLMLKEDEEENESENDCSPNCSDVFLADSYCDMGCNIEACGYDSGDCGAEMFSKLYELPSPHAQNTTYTIPKGKLSAWMNISTLLPNKGLGIEGKYEETGAVRKLVVNTAQEIMSLVLRSNYSGTVDVVLFINGGNTSLDIRSTFTFKIHFDTKHVEEIKSTASLMSMKDAVNFTFERYQPARKSLVDTSKEFSLVNVNASGFSSDVINAINNLEDKYLNGELTKKGLKYKKNLILTQHMKEDMKMNLVYFSDNDWPPTLKVNLSSLTNDNKSLIMNNLNENILMNPLNLLKNETNFVGKRQLLSLPGFSSITQIGGRRSSNMDFSFNTRGSRELLDMFSESLLYVNNLYNSHYGFDSRKVVAHAPHFIKKSILQDLQNKFPYEFELTSSHKTRQVNDMQFAFAYFYFLTSETVKKPLSAIFDEYDTDESGTWSDREIRTFLAKANKNPPLHYSYVQDFNNDVINCSKTLQVPEAPTPPYERYADSNLPTVSKELVLKCKSLSTRLKYFESIKKYHHKTESSEQIVHFKMISSNVSSVVGQLEDIRRNPRKFMCLNNNLDPRGSDNEIVHALVEDTYRAILPLPSQFELPVNYRNRFLYTHELEEWRHWRNLVRAFIYASLASLIVLTLVNFFSAEIEALKRKWCIRRRRREKLGGITV